MIVGLVVVGVVLAVVDSFVALQCCVFSRCLCSLFPSFEIELQVLESKIRVKLNLYHVFYFVKFNSIMLGCYNLGYLGGN